MRWVAALLLGLPFLALAAEPSPVLPVERCAEHVPFGQPESPRTDTTLLCRPGYLIEHDNKAKIPAWVSYLLTPERTVGCARRTADFDAEPALPPEKRAEDKDYAKSGFDRGHMANNADMRWNKQVEIDSNVLSNVAPQNPSLNRGLWSALEAQTRAWAVERGPLIVYTGPIYSRQAPSTIGKGRVTVPDAFFKVLVDKQEKEVVAFIMPNEKVIGGLSDFTTSLAEVQRQTGMVLPLPEGTKTVRLWGSSAKNVRDERATACGVAR